MGKILKSALLFAFFVVSAGFTGCMFGAADDLYVLPKQPGRLSALTELINKELDAGCELIAPVSGTWSQAVFLYDVDGDGTEEAFAFFRAKPEGLKVCLYLPADGGWIPGGSLDLDGGFFEKVSFADLNGDGAAELIVFRNICTDLKISDVCSVSSRGLYSLFTSESAEFMIADGLIGNGIPNLVSLNSAAGKNASLTLYRFASDNEITSFSADLSFGIASADRWLTGLLTDNVNALFVESTAETGETLTDIFVFDDRKFVNVALDASGVSAARRAYPVYCSDIDSDLRLEVPSARLLPGMPDSSDACWIFDWYGFNSAGERSFVLSTYHDFAGGWYYVIPDDMSDSFTVRGEFTGSGEHTLVFSNRNTSVGVLSDFLTVYTFTGETGRETAGADGRFILLEQNSFILAAEISDSSVSREKAQSSFFPIRQYRLGGIF